MALIYSLINLNLDLLLRFGGDGTFKSSQQLRLDGISGNSITSAKYSAGFKEIELTTTVFVEVDLKLFKTEATVEFNATYERGKDEPITVVTARARGVSVQIKGSCPTSTWLRLQTRSGRKQRECSIMLRRPQPGGRKTKSNC